tara:strand:- start:27278 stop:28399 length:1122 start_codon:yes stop_codon:yes gene_type:complete
LDKGSDKQIYFKELNSLRFLGFLGIFFGHVFFSNNLDILNVRWYSLIVEYGKNLGFISLDSFFVLSSFLITWKALEEYKFSKSFDLRKYIIRRSLRIWPLYFLIIFLGFSVKIFAAKFGTEVVNLPSIWSFLLFVLNFEIIENGYEFLFFMVFMWSISLEEQFYILWAIILKWLKKHLIIISFIFIASSIIFRILYIEDSLRLNFHTISSFGNFGFGALLAIFCFKQNQLLLKLKNLSKTKIVSCYFLIFIVFILCPILVKYHSFLVIKRLLFSVFYGFIILEQTYCENSIFKLSKIKYFDFFGKLSYGLYCFHGIIITVFIYLTKEDTASLFKSVIVYPTLILLFTLLISFISYNYYELRFLKLKNRFTKHY